MQVLQSGGAWKSCVGQLLSLLDMLLLLMLMKHRKRTTAMHIRITVQSASCCIYIVPLPSCRSCLKQGLLVTHPQLLLYDDHTALCCLSVLLFATAVSVLQFKQRRCLATVRPRRAACRSGRMASNWKGWRWASLMGSWPSPERRWWCDIGAASRMARSLMKLKATRRSASGLVRLLIPSCLPLTPFPGGGGVLFA